MRVRYQKLLASVVLLFALAAPWPARAEEGAAGGPSAPNGTGVAPDGRRDAAPDAPDPAPSGVRVAAIAREQRYLDRNGARREVEVRW